MTNKYGPWATLIDVGGNPQLSAFWKRRLTMLVPASRTSPVLSRRNLSLLAAAGILACLLPTVFFTPVEAQEKKPADEKSQAEAKSGGGTAGGSFSGGTLIISNAADKGKAIKSGEPSLNGPISLGGEGWSFLSHPNDLDFPFYQPLLNDRTRKELKLSAEQEQKLKEIDRSYRAEYLPKEKELIRKTDQETAKSPPEEQDKKLGEMWLTIRKQARPVRKQIEEVFSAE